MSMEFSSHLVETAQFIHRLPSEKKLEMLQIAKTSQNVPRPGREVIELLSDSVIRNRVLGLSARFGI